MLAPLLLAAALAQKIQHSPVHQAAEPVAVSLEAAHRVEKAKLDIFEYCDASRQSTIMVTNPAPSAFVVEWTLTAVMPGYPTDHWSGVSRLEPGQFEGWMSPAPYLHLDIRYDDDGQVTTNSIDALCQATTSQGSGLEE